ncbi:SagB family peptide dehydrogenase [Paenibacillus alkalitolerans]|uniref:SagB family peptide dehydrogenase n=1 Tax=Paenibacillus alkalitolerans TaxID=2799335 RepID=UPI0018F3904F|nr:SagB family peptide dehydrogenase [Paenibacillus alkalitolerans]
MNPEYFLHNLHFDIEKIRPADWIADWEDAPLPYKLYRGLTIFPLSSEVPLTLEERRAPAKPGLLEIGHMLWYVFGLTQFRQSFHSFDSMFSSRRFVPSGGGLYPNELYLYLKIDDLPPGVYHYDAAHHRLILLREGHFDGYLAKALGDRCDVSACFGTVFVSTMFWKNFFKYNNFAYRLQGLDTGVLIGQLLEVSKRFGIASGVYFQFLDRAVNHLLGLSEREESVYAVVPLSADHEIAWFAGGNTGEGTVSAAELCRELPAVRHRHYVRSQKIAEYPMLIKLNEVSLLESIQPYRQPDREMIDNSEELTVALPYANRLSYDLASVCRKRFSPGMDFVFGKISELQAAALLRESTASFLYRNDLDGDSANPVSRVSIYGCYYDVEGIPDGAYRYDGNAHELRLRRPGDQRYRLQQGMLLDNVNLLQVPICFHVEGCRDHLTKQLGYRGYRIQQMEAGMLLQRILLASAAIGLGGHPLLGFNVSLCDEIYKIAAQGKTSLIQIPVGPYRPHPKLEGSLHG